MKNEDPPSNRVKPVPVQLLLYAQDLVTRKPTAQKCAAMELCWIGFYYLLRGGEHCKTSAKNKPLLLKHIGLAIDEQVLNVVKCNTRDLRRATQSSITFDDQKNRKKGDVVAHSTSGNPIACPTKALGRRIKYLRDNGADGNTPLCSYRYGNRWCQVTSRQITDLLRAAATTMPHLNISPKEITSRSLRSGGAMALLCGKVDTTIIKLVGRWRSDAMFEYLHAQALPVVHELAATMFQKGRFTLAAGAFEPAEAQELLRQVPNPQNDNDSDSDASA